MAREKSNLEAFYQEYLVKVGLNEANMMPVQRKETKQAFMAGCTKILIHMRDEIANIEEEEDAVDTLQDLVDQAKTYFMTL
jgi:hypothetical protein